MFVWSFGLGASGLVGRMLLHGSVHCMARSSRQPCNPPCLYPAGVSQSAYQEYLPYNRDKWMIVEPTQVSADGTECNKIGTSYA